MKSKKLLILLIVMMLLVSMLLVACEKKDKGVKWGEWEIVKAPTMETAGEIKRTASDGKVETLPLPVINETNYKKTVVVEPTCAIDGEVKYTVTIKDKEYSFSFKIDMLGHSWGDPTYTWSEDNSSCVATRVCSRDSSHIETISATITSVVTAPTFDKDGEVKYTATFDKDWAVSQEKVVVGDGKYTLTKVNGKAATCTEPGLREYWAGSNGINYEDEAHTKVIIDLDAWRIIPAMGHKFGATTYEWSEDNSTCKATRRCTIDTTHSETISATIISEVTEPTFDKDGEVKYTAIFDKDWATTQTRVVAGKNQYTLTKVSAVEPTVNNAGNIEYWVGSDGKYYDDVNRTNEISLENTLLQKLAVTKVDKIDAEYGKNGQKEHYYETNNIANKYYLVDGTYVAIPNKQDLVIDELLGTITIYVNGVKQDRTISHKKSEDLVLQDVIDIVDAVSGKDYLRINSYDSDLDQRTPIFDPIEYARTVQNVSLYMYKSYEITLNANEGLLQDDDSTLVVEYGGAYGDLPVPTRTGFIFNGWYNEAGELVTVDTVTEPKNHTLKADWYTEGLEFVDSADATSLVVSKYTGSGAEVIIPSNVLSLGKPVTEIEAKAFYHNATITGVSMPDTIKKIGASAFTGLQLESLDLPSGLKYIGDMAFAYMTKIKSLKIPSSIEFIGYEIAPACYVLEYITIENGGNDLYVSSMNGVSFGGIMYVGKDAIPQREHSLLGTIPAIETYDYIMGATKSSIPSGTKRIYTGAFGGVYSVGVEIPASVVEIMGTAFMDSNLSNVSFEEGTEPLVILSDAFYDIKLTQIVLPTRISNIEADAFRDNLNIKIYLEHTTMPSWSEGWNNESGSTPADVYLYSENKPTVFPEGNIDGYWHYTDDTKTTMAIWEDPYTRGLNFAKVANGNEYEVTGYTGTDTHINIPSVYADNVVIGIKDNAEGLTNLQDVVSVTIPRSVTYIGVGAFSSCPKLESVEMSDAAALKSIGVGAFSACALTSILIPSKVNDIGVTAFGMNPTLNNIMVVPGNAHVIANGTTLVVNNTVVLGITANPVIPKTATAIGAFAFMANNSMTSFVVPANIESIGDSAFMACSMLTSIKVASGSRLTTIGDSGFGSVQTLEEVVLPSSLSSVSIDIPIFSDSPNVKIYYEGTTTLDPLIFKAGWNAVDSKSGGSSMAPIYIYSPDYPEADIIEGTAGYWRYSDAEARTVATWVVAPYSKGMTFELIDNGANYKVSGYTGTDTVVVIPSTYREKPVTLIGASIFKGNNTMESVSIGSNITKIDNCAFINCTALKSVVIPDGVTTLGYSVFMKCNSMTSLAMPASLVSIDTDIITGCTALATLTVDETNPKYSGAGNCLIDKGLKKLIIGCKGSVIPNDGSVTAIDAKAFKNCTGIESVTIPDTVTRIEGDTFRGCSSLHTVILPAGFNYIGRHAFRDCSALATITLPDNCINVDIYAFANTGLTSITIQGYGTSIKAFVFKDCTSLQTVNVKLGVHELDRTAFNNCPSLTSINYTGSVAEWGEMTRFNHPQNTPVSEVTCNDGTTPY